MALVVADRVKETTTTAGIGTLTLGGAVTGFQSFAVIGNTNTTYYAISAAGGAFYEIGIGTYTASGTTLSRDTVLASSNSGNKVDLPAGTKDVYVVYPAGRSVMVDGTSIAVPNNAVLPITAGGTGSNTATFSGANISSLNASNISTGTLANARTTASSSNGASTIVARDASGNFSANVITANGSALTALNADSITTGTLANARTTASSSNGASTIVARDASGNFSANVITANGSSITAINASNISSGTLANARTTASDANGASTIVARDASGNFSANVITANGSSITAINASNISSGTLANARTTASDANGASTIVARDASGNFSANVITANGSSITALNASNISSGTLSVARGGTGASTLTAENVIIGNTTGAVKFVAPGTSGNVLTSNGTAWASTAPASQSPITWQSVQTTNFTAAAGSGYPINTTSGNIDVTLPASPSAGNMIWFVDYAGTWDTNRVLLKPNGNKINSSTDDRVLNQDREGIALVYIDSTQGWIPFVGINAITPTFNTLSVEYLVVAGGGGGRSYSGGGAGGTAANTITLTLGTNYTVTVGAGGAAEAQGNDSVLSTVTATKGQGSPSTYVGGNSGNGFTGGQGANLGNPFLGGGGAGANANGGNYQGSTAGSGGAGISNSITGSATFYGGGGGGGAEGVGSRNSGGQGGGGQGAQNQPTIAGSSGQANTGGGGGGYNGTGASPYGGGSGVVILKYSNVYTISNPGGGLTLSTTTNGANKITTVTAGTGSISFA